MSDGTLSVRRRQAVPIEALNADGLRSDIAEPFFGTSGAARAKVRSKPTGELDELRVESRRTRRLKDYDKLLKNFKYSAALDSVLRKVGMAVLHVQLHD